jgi:hypothetical protein
MVVESDAVGPDLGGISKAWEGRRTIAQVPFPEMGGLVAPLLQPGRDRLPPLLDQQGIVFVHHGVLEVRAPGVAAREQVIAGRRANRAGRVGLVEADPLRGQLIDMGRSDEARIGAVGTDRTVAQVVGENDDDIGTILGEGSRGEPQGKSRPEDPAWFER